jgi:hypothetical protein
MKGKRMSHSDAATGSQRGVHFVLQGKGGVGKSFVAAILAQYLRDAGQPVYCFDTDPVNATFAQYAGMEAEHVNVLKRGMINEKQFDGLVESLCNRLGVCVVDTGATTFVPLWNYILENEILAFLSAHDRLPYIHSVITGGQALTDTLNGFAKIAATSTGKNIVVWLNEYFGEVHGKEGQPFDELKVAQEHAGRVIGAVTIRERNHHTFGDDVKEMLERRMTFDAAIRDQAFSLVSKQRLAIVRRDLFEQLDAMALR